MAHIGKLLMAASIAAPAGCLFGAIVAAPFMAPSGATLGTLTALVAVVALVGMVLALPALLLIGIPLSWPFRHSIYQRPWPFAALYGGIGAFAGLWLTLIVGAATRETLVPGVFLGAGTAIAWIAVLCRERVWLDPIA